MAGLFLPRAPDVYVVEEAGGARPIEAVGTSTPGFVGKAPDATKHLNEARAVNNWTEFVREYGPDPDQKQQSTDLSQAVFGFFLNGGSRCYVVNIGNAAAISGGEKGRTGLDVLEGVDEVAIVAAPGFTDTASYETLLTHCETLKDRVAILDAPKDTQNVDLLTQVPKDGDAASKGVRPRDSKPGYGAFYFPWLKVRDPLSGATVEVPASGHMAGIWARTDAERGVYKAPANETVRGALGLTYYVTRAEQESLNEAGVNCIRFFSREGPMVWGARTLAASSSEWRYLNVRRLFNMVEESIARSMRWVVFEPNDMTLWKSIRRDISAFLMVLWRGGALMGQTAEQAFFVKCDEETNTKETIDLGQVVTLVGMAPVKPAEFVIFRISQYQAGVDVTQGG